MLSETGVVTTWYQTRAFWRLCFCFLVLNPCFLSLCSTVPVSNTCPSKSLFWYKNPIGILHYHHSILCIIITVYCALSSQYIVHYHHSILCIIITVYCALSSQYIVYYHHSILCIIITVYCALLSQYIVHYHRSILCIIITVYCPKPGRL
jgi:hypothetical protein